MSQVLNSDVRRALAERIRYYNELGIYEFYRRGSYPDDTAAVVVAD